MNLNTAIPNTQSIASVKPYARLLDSMNMKLQQLAIDSSIRKCTRDSWTGIKISMHSWNWGARVRIRLVRFASIECRDFRMRITHKFHYYLCTFLSPSESLSFWFHFRGHHQFHHSIIGCVIFVSKLLSKLTLMAFIFHLTIDCNLIGPHTKWAQHSIRNRRVVNEMIACYYTTHRFYWQNWIHTTHEAM